MKTGFFIIAFLALTVSVPGQVVQTRLTQVQVYVWDVLGRATYFQKGFDLARPLEIGALVDNQTRVWVGDHGRVILLSNGQTYRLGPGTYALSNVISQKQSAPGKGFTEGESGAVPDPNPEYGSARKSPNDGSGFGRMDSVTVLNCSQGRWVSDGGRGFGQGSVPATSGQTRDPNDGSGFGRGAVPLTSGRGNDPNGGSGFGQGAVPTSSGRGGDPNGGSGFGQGAVPVTSGRGNDPNGGSGFGQGAVPVTSGRGNDPNGGSGFGQGAVPTSSGRGGDPNGGSGFGDGVTPPPSSGTRDRDTRDPNGGSGHGEKCKPRFLGAYEGDVTAGPVFFEWNTCQNHAYVFRLTPVDDPKRPIFQTEAFRTGVAVDLGRLNLQVGQTYVISISETGGGAADEAKITIVEHERQEAAFKAAAENDLAGSAIGGHRSLLNAIELEKAGLFTAATEQYNRALELEPCSELVQAMVWTFRKNRGLVP